MLVTLIRAELIEEQLVEQMDELAKRTALLNGSADAESYILENMSNTITNNTSFTYTDGTGQHTTTMKAYLTDVLQINVTDGMFPSGTNLPQIYYDTTAWSTDQKNQIISAIQTKQDELNTISQETSINIQSLINKRDQAYLLGTNAIALFYSGHISFARNM
jgi:predicted HTH domain antitoxin